jgi:hypothetical protein
VRNGTQRPPALCLPPPTKRGKPTIDPFRPWARRLTVSLGVSTGSTTALSPSEGAGRWLVQAYTGLSGSTLRQRLPHRPTRSPDSWDGLTEERESGEAAAALLTTAAALLTAALLSLEAVVLSLHGSNLLRIAVREAEPAIPCSRSPDPADRVRSR